MDAAQKLLKNIAILTATALLLSTVGLAAPTLVAPATVAISATGFNTASVLSSAAGTTEITYTIGPPNYSADPTVGSAWLTVTGGTTTPANLIFTARNAAGLTAAMHTAAVTLTPTSPAGAGAVTIMVTFDTSGAGGGGGGGGGSTTLTGSSTTVPLDNTTTSANVAISTNSASDITINNPLTVSGTSSGGITWLSASLSNYTFSSASGAILAVNASLGGLAASNYQGTVTLVPSSGTPLVITVNLTVNGGGGGGGGGGSTWSTTPSSVSWNFTANSGAFPTPQPVTVTVPNGPAFYSVVTTANSSSSHWLLVAANNNPPDLSQGSIPVSSGFTLSVGSAANSLTQGTYTERAIIYGNTVQQTVVTVTLNVNGGNSSQLVISPTSVPFTSALNAAPQSQVVSVTSATGGPLSVTGCSFLNWLTCTLPSTNTLSPGIAGTFTVNVNPAGLTANTYSGTLQIQVGAQSGIVNVNLVVSGSGGGGGGTGTTAVAPTSLSFAYQFGTNPASIARQKLVITGPAGAWTSSIAVTTPNGGTWLNLGPSSGAALPDPSVDGATPIVSINPTGLGVGTYTGNITVTAPVGTQIVEVSLKVLSSTIILPTPGALVFTAQTGQAKPGFQNVFFTGSDSTLNPLSITAVASDSWMSITTGATYVSVQVDQTGLGTGVYSGSVSVSQTGAANSPTTIPVLLVVNGGGSGGASSTLTFSESAIAFTSTNGVTSPSSPVLTVGAATATSFVGSIAYTSGLGGWLTVSPLSGVTPSNLSVSASAGTLASGSYGATISFTANGTVQTVGVTLRVGTGGNVTVSPTVFSFAAPRGSSPATQSLGVSNATGSAGISFTTQVTAGSNWLSTSASASTNTSTTPATLTVTVSSSTLDVTMYSGNILITPSGGAPVNIPVTLTITAPATVSAAPTALTFDYRLGDSAPAAQPITVSGSGAAFSATPTSSGNWLVATPATGTTPRTVNVSINTANLTAGVPTYTGTILVAGTGDASGSTTVNVTLNVSTPLPTITKVTNGASYATGSISPGEIITLFANDPNHPIGPATPAYLSLDANGNVATSIGGVQVTVAGYLCPMIYASASQVSVVVPYEVKGHPTAAVEVKFLGQGSNGVPVDVATTAPGVFTINLSGTGPGAILNSSNNILTTESPAARGDIVSVYMTGEGETSPAGVTGKITTLALPPQPLTPKPLLPVSVTIGGQPADWTFAGEAPGFVSGAMQLNVVVPTNIAAGDQPIVVTIGGNPSQPGVTVRLK